MNMKDYEIVQPLLTHLDPSEVLKDLSEVAIVAGIINSNFIAMTT